ncbi:hypothetical protein N836_13855 [Leptolyngbya sp. Heron Island J]|nr:hypothetical protein N836_13855 [Leptolyngbya sp. Heron Island J]
MSEPELQKKSILFEKIPRVIDDELYTVSLDWAIVPADDL